MSYIYQMELPEHNVHTVIAPKITPDVEQVTDKYLVTEWHQTMRSTAMGAAPLFRPQQWGVWPLPYLLKTSYFPLTHHAELF